MMRISHLFFACFGSLVASFGGLVLSVAENTAIYNPAFIVAIAGVITSISAVVSAIGNQVVAFAKIWSDSKKADREAAVERHDLANKLNVAQMRLSYLEASHEEEKQRTKIMVEMLGKMGVALDSFMEWKKIRLPQSVESGEISDLAKDLRENVDKPNDPCL